MHRVSTGPKISFGPQSENLGSIIRGFKTAVTTLARKIGLDFALQARYHDYIIRDKAEHQGIKTYFRDDPKNWEEDYEHPIPPGWET
jgi:hypothetical protein